MRAFLRDVGNHGLRVEDEFALVRFQLTEEHGEQRRLAATVGADHAHALSGMDLQAGVFEQDLAATAQRDVGEGEHDRRDYRGSARAVRLP